jgi:hypothetical protein
MHDPLNTCYALPPRMMATETTPLFMTAMRGGRYSSSFVLDELGWATEIDTKLLHPHSTWTPPTDQEVTSFADTHRSLLPARHAFFDEWEPEVKPGFWRRVWNWVIGRET